MIRFIICDDNKEACENAKMAITKCIINHPYEYEIDKFRSFNSDLNKIINNQEDQKIYILDIELQKVSGLEIATKIRKVDWKSVIIFVTAHTECKNDIFYSRLLALDFISKCNKYQDRLKETIDYALKYLEKSKILIFSYKHNTYRILHDDILYIEKINGQRKCLIITKDNSIFPIKKNISDFELELGSNFYRTHSSCIVNIKEIKKIDYANGFITFKNNVTINLLSQRMKKGLKEYVENH